MQKGKKWAKVSIFIPEPGKPIPDMKGTVQIDNKAHDRYRYSLVDLNPPNRDLVSPWRL